MSMHADAAALARPEIVPGVSLLTGDDLFLFNEGNHFRLFDKLGAHPMTANGVQGTYFAVWAPGAERVAVMGDFNSWDKNRHDLRPRGSSGIWEGFVSGVGRGAIYKYHVVARHQGYRADKADPLAFYNQTAPETASIVWDHLYDWGDATWMATRGLHQTLSAPISIYEMHLGSWQRVPEEGNRPLTYRELAPRLANYLAEMGFTHVEFLPVMEHPFYGSWGYQVTGFFAPTSRYGTPQDFMYLVDYLHQHGLGVILDWVPSHFPTDEHGLIYFVGEHVYEHQSPQQGYHPDWNTAIFNYGRHEVRAFLISSAMFWLDKFHVDGLRVDAVASMLYLDYSRKEGEWIPNRYGGRENLEAITFLRKFNEEVHRVHPDVLTMAEESTAWPMVSRPTYLGGLGFDLKWDMGWNHDTLEYFKRDPIHRRYHHDQLTFRAIYAFTENYVLCLSHDEVVYGKRALVDKMPGDEWQRFANARLLLGYMYMLPGKKLLFMGSEFGQIAEWNHERSLDWHVLQYPVHAGLKRWVQDLNRVYREQPGLHEEDCASEGFYWINASDCDNSVLTFVRRGRKLGSEVVVACNFTPVPRHGYVVGVPHLGYWKEILNSDAELYAGSGQGNLGGVEASPYGWNGQPARIEITLPPLGIVVLTSA